MRNVVDFSNSLANCVFKWPISSERWRLIFLFDSFNLASRQIDEQKLENNLELKPKEEKILECSAVNVDLIKSFLPFFMSLLFCRT